MAGQNARGNRGSEGVDYRTFAEIQPIWVPLLSSLFPHARYRVSPLEYDQFCPRPSRRCSQSSVYARPDVGAHGYGGNAEYMVAKESQTALKPRSLDQGHAAAIPVAAVTPWRALFDTAGLENNPTVLTHGPAAGGGQLCRPTREMKGGAHIVGTASSRNHAFRRETGVDQAIDYQKTRLEG
jgi:NADPH:quinone reductase-like Zn-dependent oxidoreductase